MGSGSGESWVLPSDATAAVLARRRVEALCGDLPQDKIDVALLLVSELVTNAVRHGAGSVRLTATRRGAELRIEVIDEGMEMPGIVEQQPLAEGGAGLRLVEALASSWGVEPLDGWQPGKRVWCVLR